MIISRIRWENSPKKKVEGDIFYIWLDNEKRYQEVEIKESEPAPMYGMSAERQPWTGSCETRPWEYKVTAVIPCLNTPETLPICIELLRLQTTKPFIMIIDTGSTKDNLEKIEELRAEDVEVHSIRLNGARHPRDYPAMAMDVAFALCRTEYIFATHSDCFIRKRTLLWEFLELCRQSPAVGYETSHMGEKECVGAISHTASMYHVPTMDKIGFGWSLRRLCNGRGIADYRPDPNRPNWPKSETLGNQILRENGIVPYLVGQEKDHCRNVDENIDHFSGYTSAKTYSPKHFEQVSGWYYLARRDALERIIKWSSKTLF